MKTSIIIILIAYLAFGCKRKVSPITPKKDILNIVVDSKNKELPWDSLISEQHIVPLETKKECLIGKVNKIEFHDGKFFILDISNKSLFVFHNNGKFDFKINKIGKGPGEYTGICDFQIDKVKNKIHILSFYKMMRFSIDGEFEDEWHYTKAFKKTKYQCIPNQFAITRDGGYYLWGGSIGVSKHMEQQYAMYKIKSLKVVKKYFPVNRPILEGQRFFSCNSFYNIKPIQGNDTIYSLTESGIYPNYFIDFGKNALSKDNLPANNSSFEKKLYQLKYNTNICTNINNLLESKEHIYFTFAQKGMIKCTVFSKESSSSVSGLVKTTINKFVHPGIISCLKDSMFVSVLSPYVIHDVLGKSNPNNDYRILLKKINLEDNPILILSGLKSF